MPIAAFKATAGTPPEPPATPTDSQPGVAAEIAFASNPAAIRQTYTNVSSYLRNLSTARGRNYEYDRSEAGNSQFTLDDRTSAFNPDNTAGPFYPNLKPTRRCRLQAVWDDTTYSLFEGYTKGYPVQFLNAGFDAIVAQSASDTFYRLNMLKFRPPTTTLTDAINTAPAPDTVEMIQLDTDVTGWPQFFPYTVTIDGEDIEITARADLLLSAKRAQNDTVPLPHAAGATVTSRALGFGEELSGARIQHVLELAGIIDNIEIDPGISMIGPSEDLAGQNVLEHLLFIAEAENGRLFVSRTGVLTFQDRHWVLRNERADRGWFSDAPGHDPLYASETTLAGETTLVTTGGPVIPYSLPGPVQHDESKIANVVRVTPASGRTQTTSDQTSITENFERVLEKQWPLASDLDAKAASEWMVANLKDATVRIPELTVYGQHSPDVMWPLLLSMEIGQRYGFQYAPKGGGDPIVRSVIIEGIRHDIVPGSHRVTLQLSPADTTAYWRLGVAGYSEIGETTRVTY